MTDSIGTAVKRKSQAITPEQPVLIVAGMHRSGTSLMTGLLHSAGLFVGERLMAAAESNPEGHFEDLDFYDLHQRALRASGLDVDGFLTGSTGTMPPLLRDEAAGMIAARRATGVPWGWKDPRNTLFLDFWKSMVPDAHWLFMVRSPWDVIDSLFRRSDLAIRDNPQAAIAIWAHYNRLVRDFVGANPGNCTVIDVSQVFADPSACVRKVAKAASIPLGEPKAPVRPELITPVASAHRIALVASAEPGVLELYSELLGLAGAAEPPTMRIARDEQLDAGGAAVLEWAASSEHQQRRRAAERRVHDLDAQVAGLRGELDSQRSRLSAELTAERQARQSEVEADRLAAAEANRAISERDERNRALEAVVAAKEQALAKADAARLASEDAARLQGHALSAIQQSAEAERQVAARSLAAARDALQARMEQLDMLRQIISNREDDIAALRQQAAEAAAEHERIRTAMDREIVRRGEHNQLLDRQIEEYRNRIRVLDGEIERERAAHRATEADRVRILRSNSMKMLSPLRAIRRLFSNPRLQVQMTKGALARGCRWLYDRLPISMETRLRHRARLAGRAPGLLVASGSPPESVPGVVRVKQPLVLVPMATLPGDRADTTSQSGADVARESVVIRPSESPMVSVIVPVHNQWDYTLACIKSLLAAEPKLEFEVILADDASTDDTAKAAQLVKGLVVCRHECNLGFLRNCNAAAQVARGRYLLLLNNDTQVQPGALSEMLKVFSTRPDAGLVGAKLVYPDGALQEAGGIVWRDGSAWNYGRNSDPSFGEFNYLKEVDYCSGACIMVPAELWRQLGGFDERYSPAYCEDTDFAFSVRAAGKKVYYQPTAVVVHFEGKSHGTDTSQGVKAYQIANQQKFLDRWRDTLEREHFANGERVFVARDRSRHKKCILVIDHYVPQPDRDAGSRTMVQFMRLFLDAGMNVKFWPQNLWYDPVYTSQLESMGVEVFHGARYAERFGKWIREHGQSIDYALLSRPYVAVEYIDLIRANSAARLLYYGHDVHHLRLRDEMRLMPGNEKLKQAAAGMESLERKVWGLLDVVYYPSDTETAYVEDCARQFGLQVAARTVPVYSFDSFAEDPGGNLATRRDLVFVAGFSHRPNADAAEWLVEHVMPLVWRQEPGVRLHLVGSNPTEQVRALAGPQVMVTGYVSDDELDRFYRRARVAVAPLRYGAGVKGKVVEAMRFGLPVVTSSVGAQGLAAARHAIAVADEPVDFAAAIIGLLRDDGRWLQASAGEQSFAKEHFSVDALKRVFAEHVEFSPKSP